MSTKVSKSKTECRTHQIVLHYLRLIIRAIFALIVAFFYGLAKIEGDPRLFGALSDLPVFFYGMFAWFIFEMIEFRILPTRLDSLGSRKQRKSHYQPSEDGATPSRRELSHGLIAFTLIWGGGNLALGILHLLGILDAGVLFLVFLGYSICDSVCILFFCPIRRWFLKNRCCTSCRIYNWDYAMMCTPLFFLPHPLTYLVSAFALYILLDWEIAFFRHPERFSTACNNALLCKNCTERLCTHSKELAGYVKKYAKKLRRADEKKAVAPEKAPDENA